MATKADGSIVIKAVVDITDANKSVEKIADNFDDAGASAADFADILKGNLLSNAIMSGLQTLGNYAGDLARDFIDSAADVKAETSQFEQTFGDFAGAATEAIGEVADSSGILDTRLNTLGSQLYAFARASGGTTTESMVLMQEALQAAADGAAYYDRSLEDTTETLQSFLKGNYENDAALGLSATETTRNTAAMKLFGKEFADLSEIQKQQTLLQMVKDAQALSGAAGQASREMDGWENVQGNLNESWRQFMAQAGGPILENLVPIIQNITASLQEWTANIDWEAFGAQITEFVNTIIENGPTIVSIIAGIGAGFIAWNVASVIQSVVGKVTELGGVLPAVTSGVQSITKAISANWIGIIVSAIAAVVTTVITLWNTNEEFRAAVIAIWEAISGFFASIWEAIAGFFTGAWDKISGVWDTVTEYFAGVWKSIKEIFSTVADVLKGFFVAGWNAIKSVVGSWAGFFRELWAGILGIFDQAWQKLKEWAGFVAGVFGNFADTVKGIFDGLWNGIKTIINGILGGIEWLANGVVNGINTVIRALNNLSFDIPAWVPVVGGQSFGFNIPLLSAVSIPRLAEGAVIPPNREFMAVLGDQKSGNNIEAPESLIRRIVREETGGLGSGRDITIVMELNGREFGRAVYKANNEETQRVGVSLAGVRT